MKKVGNYIESAILLIVIFVCLLPFVYMFFMSWKSTLNAYDFSFSLKEFTIQHYQTIFKKPEITRYFFNSIFVAVCGVILTLITSCLAGYAFARMKFRGNPVLFLLVTITMFIPGEAILIQMYTVTRNFGMLNTFWALILPLPTALSVFIVRQAILAVPVEIIESARIDGARELS
ncbi:MAG: carbohydrate ABC transporter permease, partial [Firmicutes bacterium]|nr:carbohydrate ABC transporter permease [Candidatus Scybalomonas excrementavium]